MAGLEGSVKVPGLGDVPKKNAAVAGGVIASIVGVSYYRKRKATAAALAAGTDTGMSTVGTDALGGTLPVGPGDLSGGGGPITTGGDQIPAPINLQNPGILTNSDWKSAGSAIDLGGIDASVISAALSRVLGGSAVSQAQAEIFNEVSGEIGYPPQGYPPIKLTTTTPGTPHPVPVPIPATPSSPSTLPRGPYRFMKTDSHFRTVPTIAQHFRVSSATVIRYNPEIAKNHWDAHHLPVGVTIRLPA